MSRNFIFCFLLWCSRYLYRLCRRENVKLTSSCFTRCISPLLETGVHGYVRDSSWSVVKNFVDSLACYERKFICVSECPVVRYTAVIIIIGLARCFPQCLMALQNCIGNTAVLRIGTSLRSPWDVRVNPLLCQCAVKSWGIYCEVLPYNYVAIQLFETADRGARW